MDTDLLKTFLEVNRTRHFGRASENLYITQSAVSARIRQLEELLGVSLFVRLRNDIRLTAAGSRLVKHAESILNTWNRARQDAALGGEDKLLLAIGGMYSLWDILLQDWINHLYHRVPNVALQAEAHGPETLVRKLLDGTLDVAIMFEPPQLAELLVTDITDIKLMLVATRPGLTAREALANDYVMVDWGTSFAITHARHFVDVPPPAIRMGLGRMALAFVLTRGGAAYLAERMVDEHVRGGRLFPVDDAPVIDRQVFAVYPHHGERLAVVEEVLGSLREQADRRGH